MALHTPALRAHSRLSFSQWPFEAGAGRREQTPRMSKRVHFSLLLFFGGGGGVMIRNVPKNRVYRRTINECYLTQDKTMLSTGFYGRHFQSLLFTNCSEKLTTPSAMHFLPGRLPRGWAVQGALEGLEFSSPLNPGHCSYS